MNKIVWNTEELREPIDTLEIKGKDTVIKFFHHVKINEIIFPEGSFHTTWLLEENSFLEIHSIITCKEIKGSLEICSTNHTNCNIHLGINAVGQNELEIQNKIEGNENITNLKVRVIGEENSKTKIITTGILLKETKENTFLEDVKYLNETESIIECHPKLIVDSNEVVANHNVTIGSISESDLFYLESKGIETKNAKNLIRKCFLNSVLK